MVPARIAATTRGRARQPPARRRPLVRDQYGPLPPPRARRILVFTADAEVHAPSAGRGPGTARPGGRPRIPAHSFCSVGRPERGRPERGRPERGRTFPMATVPPGLERGRRPVGAPGPAATPIPTPGPAATAVPAPGAPVPPAGPATARRRRLARPGRRRLARPGRRRLARPGRVHAGPAGRARVLRPRGRRGRRPGPG